MIFFSVFVPGSSFRKLPLLPNLWVTQGVQVIFDPTFNPQEVTITVSRIRAHLFF